MTAIQNKYAATGKFQVLAFPCNQFGAQEPGTLEEIEAAICPVFKPTFPILDKIEVNGKGAAPLYEYLKTACPGILGTTSVKWNFTMFLTDMKGNAVYRFSPGPSLEEVEKELMKYMA